MINYLWMGLIIAAFIVGGITGQIDRVSEAIFQGAEDSVRLIIDLLGPIALWLGIMNIAQESGFTHILGRLIKPLINLIFPELTDSHPARGAIVLNMVANILGLGNSATPLGIKAMQELQNINQRKERASLAMCTLLALNTSSITIIPATIISLRVAYNSNSPTIIIISSIFATSISTVTALCFDRFFRIFTRE